MSFYRTKIELGANGRRLSVMTKFADVPYSKCWKLNSEMELTKLFVYLWLFVWTRKIAKLTFLHSLLLSYQLKDFCKFPIYKILMFLTDSKILYPKTRTLYSSQIIRPFLYKVNILFSLLEIVNTKQNLGKHYFILPVFLLTVWLLYS